MANQYRDQDRERYETNRGGRDYGSKESGRFGSRSYQDRDEKYFGSGRMQYGQGYRDEDVDHSYNDEISRFNQPSRSYTGGYGADIDRSYSEREGDYYRRSDPGRSRGSGRDRDRSYYSGPSGYRGDYSERYGSSYPTSESGYDLRGEERGWWDKTSDEVASWFGDEEAARRREQDDRNEGGHRGRGPSNYQRSDDRIKEDVNDRLTDSWYVDASNVEVEVNQCEVTLTGTVESRKEKRYAEDIAEDVSGVKNVENRLRVSGRENNVERSVSPTVNADTSPESTTSRSRSASI